MSGEISRTGRMSTWEPGRKATAPLRSTVKPPLTRPKMMPVTRSSSEKDFSSRTQDSSRRAFSRLSMASPLLFSSRSTKTSTSSPGLMSESSPGEINSFRGTWPSDFRPTSTSTMSFSMEMIRPLVTVPSKLCCFSRDSSRSSAKFSLVVISAANFSSVAISATGVSPSVAFSSCVEGVSDMDSPDLMKPLPLARDVGFLTGLRTRRYMPSQRPVLVKRDRLHPRAFGRRDGKRSFHVPRGEGRARGRKSKTQSRRL